MDPDPFQAFYDQIFAANIIQEPEKKHANNGDGDSVGRLKSIKKSSYDGGIKRNERKNEEKLGGCKLSLAWFGDGKIVRQDYPLKSP